MATNKKYWKGFEELTESPVMEQLRGNEFPEELPVDEFLGNKGLLENSSTSRRDFLKYLGFSTAAATLAACESPIIESIPYVVKPEEITPGIANFYASTYYDGHDFASVLVKTREGRPIKFEPNDLAPVNGGTNARVQGAVLSLYDNNRLKQPLLNGAEVSWGEVDKAVRTALEAANASGKKVVLLTGSVVSPSTRALIAQFGSAYTNFEHVEADAYSYSNKLDLYQELLGVRALPTHDFSKADVVVGVGADFLGDWYGLGVAKAWADRRKPGKNMSRHIQIESGLSLTGSNADKRIKVKPSQQGAVLVALYNAIAAKKGAAPAASVNLDGALAEQIKNVAAELTSAGTNSLVVCGGNSKEAEAVCLAINNLLGNIGTTVKLDSLNYLRQGNDAAFANLVKAMKSGEVGALIMSGVNPVYTSSSASGFSGALEKVPFSLTLTDRADETAAKTTGAAPLSHNLESWGYYRPVTGVYTLQQPTIRPLFNSRQLEENLMTWAGVSGDFYGYLRANMAEGADWNQALHDGCHTTGAAETATPNWSVIDANLGTSAAALAGAKSSGFEIEFYQKAGMGAGHHANNPWLQELPDPITRTTWDNYITISAADAADLGLVNKTQSNGALNGSRVNLTVNGVTLENVPVLIQPGQAAGSIGLAVGYGRTAAGKAGNGVGINVYPAMTGDHFAVGAEMTPAEGEHEFACTQLAHTMMGRKIVNETDLKTFLNGDVADWNDTPTFETYKGPLSAGETNLWQDFDHETGHMWNLSIDLNACTGCGACVVACHAENNVPVVGKDEIRRSRDMHWLRIDRYYSSDMTEAVADESGIGAIDKFAAMEVPAENPTVVFQPVMCQHCNHAPCETVCPVAATSHSAEGLNHMAYNRCIGTRYCANNCPYKVRRFNWFLYNDNQEQFDINYSMNDDLGKMVLNPDVTVRSRGVMEKCSFCIQRIQLGKLEAKKAGRPIRDGEFTVACAQACDTGAMTFGDVNNPESRVAAQKKDNRMYHLLEEVGTQPSVFYLTKVRNQA